MSHRPKHAKKPASQTQPIAYQPVQPVQPARSAANTRPTPAYEEYNQFTRASWQHEPVAIPKKKKGSVGKKIGVTLLVLLALLVAGAGFYVWNLDSRLAFSGDEKLEKADWGLFLE